MKTVIHPIILFSCALIIFIIYLNQFYGWFIFTDSNFNETYVSLRFDDGWKSQLNVYEALKKRNMTGSIYLTSEKVGQEGYMSWEDIIKVSEIMEIGGHTSGHVDLKNSLEIEKEIGDNYKELEKMGFNISSFVFPYGNYNEEVLKVIKKYYKCASTQDVGVNTPETDLYLLKDFTLRKRNNLEDIKRVIKPNTWIIFTFHDVGEPALNSPKAVKDNAVSLELFEEILDYLNNNGIKVITIKEGCEKLYEKKI